MAGRLETPGECTCTLVAASALDTFALTLARRLTGLATVRGLTEAVFHNILWTGKNPLAASCDTRGFRPRNSWFSDRFGNLSASIRAHNESEQN